jgi:hypothetical protein
MDDDDDGSLADRIHAAFERGAADARHAEVTLAKLVRDQRWDPAEAAQYLAAAAADQVLLSSEHSIDRFEVASDALLAFAVAMELVDPHAIPACLEELAEATGIEPELDALTGELFEETARRRREAAS